jgi:hypothetical protein
MQPYKAIHTRVPSLNKDPSTLLTLPKIKDSQQQRQEDTISRVTKKAV